MDGMARSDKDKAAMMYILTGVSRDTSEIARGVYRDDKVQINRNIDQIEKRLKKLQAFFDKG